MSETNNDDDMAADWAASVEEDDSEDQDAMAADWAAMADDDEDQDEMAAQWEAMSDGNDSDVFLDTSNDIQSTRILDQEEIDSLLGFQDYEEDDSNSGIRSIINSSLVSYERLPMLEVVFDRLVRMLSTSLRNFTSDNVEVSLDNITSLRFGDYLNSIPLPAMLGVFRAEEWDDLGLLTVDSALIYSIVDVLLGGRKTATSTRIEGRPYTTIEHNLVERMLHVILNDISASFDPLSPVTFRFERLETNPRFASISRSGNAVILARLRVDMDDRGGRIELCLPYATLEPIRELLMEMFVGEKFGRDSIWESHLANELWRTDVEIEALLGQVLMPLEEVLNLEVGSKIMLNVGPESPVKLRCGGEPLFVGKMGRKDGNISIRVEGRAGKAKI